MSQCQACASNAPAYLRVSALAIAAYDYIWTLPVEWDMYRMQTSICRLGRGCILFVLIRYTSVVVLVTNSVGYFSSGWSLEGCRHYFYVNPVFKSLQTLVAGTILFIRTWAISRRSKRVFWFLLIFLVISFAVELWSSVSNRVPVQDATGNCISANLPGHRVSWIFYLVTMLYDLTCLIIATGYLYHQSVAGVHGLSRSLLKEGLLYYVVLQSINIANLIVFLVAGPEGQSAAAALGYTFTWIMAQRLLIQLHRMRRGSSWSTRSTSGGLGEPSSRGLKFVTRPSFRHRSSSVNVQNDAGPAASTSASAPPSAPPLVEDIDGLGQRYTHRPPLNVMASPPHDDLMPGG